MVIYSPPFKLEAVIGTNLLILLSSHLLGFNQLTVWSLFIPQGGWMIDGQTMTTEYTVDNCRLHLDLWLGCIKTIF